jgi:hypothetical protein
VKQAYLFLLVLLSPMGLSAAPQLDLEIRLDPANRKLSAVSHLIDTKGLPGFALAPGFRISSMKVDGKAVNPAKLLQHTGHRYRLPEGSRRISLAYEADLQALANLDHRQVLDAQPAMSGEEGSFLPGGSGWYPDPGVPFSYRVILHLPAGQKGLVPGDLVKESETGKGYVAEYVLAHPAEGIELMAGPYAVQEHALKLPSGRQIRIRTWFHAELAEFSPTYLEDSARYILRYSRLIGDYPFGLFSIVSSPLPTGFGMPSLTYLGREVIRLPFIRATSLGHEVLHNWWGNGVFPDWRQGNWSEGLTTFLADYAYKEDAGADSAREMRLGWLRDLAALPPAEDIALKGFVSRRHGISSIVGYNKSAMVFFMLRDLIGREALEHGLRQLWRDKRFQTASWADLEAAFAKASGRPLGAFFRQWVDQPGAPDIRLSGASSASGDLRLGLSQSGNFALRVPLRLVYANRSEDVWVEMAGRQQTIRLSGKGDARAVQLDPDYRVWRRVDPRLMPAILREIFVAPRASVLVADDSPDLQSAARALAGKVLDARPEMLPGDDQAIAEALLVIGSGPAVDVLLARRGLAPRPPAVAGQGSAQVWADRDASGRPYAVISVRDAASLKALERGLPHYGRQSWLVFDSSRAIAKGVAQARPEQVEVSIAQPGH